MENSENLHITINEVTKEYSREKGIYQINAKFETGKLNLVIGENGSGKSTLLKCIMGLVNYQGKIIKRRIRIGYAPEEYIMPLNLTVIDFLYSIGRIKGLSVDDLSENVNYYLKFFDLINYKYKPIGSLSHGMRQKVNLMQAFIQNPKILILDEPLTGLDQNIIPKVIKLIKDSTLDKLVVVSTHNINLFKTRNRKIFHFKAGKLIVD